MPKILNECEIKRASHIEDIVGRRVPLKPARSGGHLEGSCPFHPSKSGRSFHVDPERGSWYCFGCSEGGSLADFLMKFENCDYPGALEIMAAESGVMVQYAEGAPSEGGDRPQATRQQILQALEAACRHYQERLKLNPKALEYLEKRGFGADVVARWRFGYAFGSSVAAVASKETLVAAGVLKGGGIGGDFYDPLAGRVTIPLCDHAGRVLGFTGRLIDGSSDRPKYLNTGETMVFKKGRTLFGLREAKELARSRPKMPLHVLEGQLKAVAAIEAGLPAVAAGGTAFTPEQAALAVGVSERVAICPDPDEAGLKSVLANAPVLRDKEAEVFVGELEVPDSLTEPVKDPDDLRAMGLPVKYQYYGLVDWLYGRLTDGLADAEGLKEVTRRLLPVVEAQPLAALRWRELGRLAELSGVPESEWRSREPRASDRRGTEAVEVRPAVEIDRTMSPDRVLLAAVLRGGPELRGWESWIPWADLPAGLLGALAQVSHIRRYAEAFGVSVADAAAAVADGDALAYYRYWLSVDVGRQDVASLASSVSESWARRLAARAAASAKYSYAEFLNQGGGNVQGMR